MQNQTISSIDVYGLFRQFNITVKYYEKTTRSCCNWVMDVTHSLTYITKTFSFIHELTATVYKYK